MQFTPSVEVENLTGSDVVLLGLGVGYAPIASLGVNYEVRGALPLEASRATGTGTPFEGLLTGRYVTEHGGFLLGGASLGLTPGVGAAKFRLVLGGGFGTARPGAYDADGDGLVDAEDACPTDPGLEAFEGCPAGVTLRVSASLDGQRISGAEVRVEGSVIHEDVTSGLALTYSVPANSMWRGTARLGDCLMGDKVVRAGEADVSMVIPLAFRPGARIRIVVRDVNGSTVDGVRVRFESEDPFCAPPEAPTLDPEGRLALDVGVGGHAIIVDAPGFRAHQETLTLSHSDDREVFVLLTPE